MMTGLFLLFDPSSILTLSLNWMIMLMAIISMSPYLWKTASPMSTTLKWLLNKLNKEIKPLFTNQQMKMNSLIITSVFVMVFNVNLVSLLPFVFNPTSHLSLNLSLVLPLWTGMMLFSLTQVTNNWMAHMVPQGTPNLLMPFMVLIESISSMIRPITLSIRLSANMIAGHLLLTLLSSKMTPSFETLNLLIITPQVTLMILELGVSLVQSYVISVLMALYLSELYN